MKRELFPWLLLLAAFGILIWLAAAPLPGGELLLPGAALAVFFLLGKSSRTAWRRPSLGLAIAAVAVLALALGLSSLVVASLAWTALLGAMVKPEARSLRRTLILAPLFFPWVAEAHALGWWFRWSGAAVTDHTLGALGVAITRDGTLLSVAGHELSVEAACAGLGTMQALLLAGAVAALLAGGSDRTYWSRVLCLPLIAWGANTLRLILTALSCQMSLDAFTREPLHSLLGILIALGAFLLWRPSVAAPSRAATV